MKKRLRAGIVILLVSFIAIAVVFRYFHPGQQTHTRKSAIHVMTVKVILKDAPLFIKAQGSVEASRSVAISPQVTGIIQKIGFTPGENVRVGQLLFQIDPTTYQAALVKAQANLARDQAQLKMIQKDKSRYETLVKKGFVSKQQYEQIQAQFDEQQSTIKLDAAAIQQAQAELNYTRILAPISGKTGNVTIKEGDLVDAAGDNILVTINQLSPVFVNFYLPQSDLALLMQYEKENALKVEIYGGGQKQLLDMGMLSFIDNTVDVNTGTILLKASTPNKKNLLWPGESVIVKLIFTVEKNVLAIPSQAVQMDQNGDFVYVIKNNQAWVTPVNVLRQIGKETFISQGLKQGDEVATVFPPDLNNKSRVVVKAANTE